MNKTIKIDDKVYDRLEQIRDKRETFSQVVERLIKIHDGLGQLISVVEGQQNYQKELSVKRKEKQ